MFSTVFGLGPPIFPPFEVRDTSALSIELDGPDPIMSPPLIKLTEFPAVMLPRIVIGPLVMLVIFMVPFCWLAVAERLIGPFVPFVIVNGPMLPPEDSDITGLDIDAVLGTA